MRLRSQVCCVFGRAQRIAVFIILFFSGGSYASAAVTVKVLGNSDPWLAGMPVGSGASGGDSAPTQSPRQVLGLIVETGSPFSFQASGGVSHGGGTNADPPDGSGSTYHNDHAQNGIADITAPFDALLGVFLGPDQPDLSPAPAGLDFGSSGSRNYLSLHPLLKQPFFVGNGLTGAAQQQVVVAPEGATRLFLGTMDSTGWNDNTGSFSVTILPEPHFFALVGCACTFVFGAGMRRVR